MTSWTRRAHEAVRGSIGAGDTVVDATVGNGHDTCFLAERVGPSGMVCGFDLQEEALRITRRRLEDRGLGTVRVDLIHAGHEEMGGRVAGPVAAVMFNLGYLPGGDHGLTTSPGTTLAALAAAARLLRPGGLISVVCYRGHPGGAEEAAAVCRWADGLAPHSFTVEVAGRDATVDGPFLVLVRKTPDFNS